MPSVAVVLDFEHIRTPTGKPVAGLCLFLRGCRGAGIRTAIAGEEREAREWLARYGLDVLVNEVAAAPEGRRCNVANLRGEFAVLLEARAGGSVRKALPA